MEPVHKMPIADQVVDKIRTSIMDGTFGEGSKLPSEQALCSSLRVSRSTIREAFRVLQTMGYVEMKPGRGAYVLSTTGDATVDVRDWFRVNAPKLTDFIEVRKAIESLAIKIAVDRSTQEEYDKLFKINEDFIQAVHADDSKAMAFLDESFHREIVDMSHNSLLVNINGLVAQAFKKYRSISFQVRKNALNAIEPHREILAALKARDSLGAVKSIENHLTLAREDMEAVISI
ncbi:MAG: FadR family transcriptional regulator [Spirochaetae bacterium HGW-Spirochaetae-2]|jgi:GntR family transcriptional repressor for pyruvate dehydrogenase complex|nr:MAG: FadR family transcriptional regulator [Spirochaetae bacterium HGW-Spirochaetae-2]